MTTPDTALYAALQSSPLARDLSPDQCAVLAGLVTLEHYPRQHLLAREGSTDNRLYVIVEGSLDVVKQAGTDEHTVLVTLHPGDFAHELGFLDGAQRYASLVAATEAKVLVLEREKLESLIDTHPRILYRVMCTIVRTVHRIQGQMAAQARELTNYIFKQHGRY